MIQRRGFFGTLMGGLASFLGGKAETNGADSTFNDYWKREIHRHMAERAAPPPRRSPSNGLMYVDVKYSRELAIDDDRTTIVTTRGIATFADRIKGQGLNADHFGNSIVPALPGVGFRRVLVDVAINKDGNVLEFRCVDRETSYELGA